MLEKTLNQSQTERRILHLAHKQTLNNAMILHDFGYKTRTRNIRTAINKLLELNLITYTIPDKPRSNKQQYNITQKGKDVIKSNDKTEL